MFLKTHKSFSWDQWGSCWSGRPRWAGGRLTSPDTDKHWIPESYSIMSQSFVNGRFLPFPTVYECADSCINPTHLASALLSLSLSLPQMEIPASSLINRYIACQGPLPNTCPDFWQMTWEQGSSMVVMLTTQVERGRVSNSAAQQGLRASYEPQKVHKKAVNQFLWT